MSAPRNGRGLKAFRKAHGLSQADIGVLFDLPQPRVSVIETRNAALSAEQRALLRAWAREYGGQAGGAAAGGAQVHVPRSGARLKTLREGRDLKQVEMAKVLGISQPYLSQIETNDLPLPAKARRLLRTWLGAAGQARARVNDDEADEEPEVELPWSVPRTGGGLKALLKQLDADRGLTLSAVARGCSVGGQSLRQYTYLDELPKRFIAKLKKFLAKHA